MADPLNDITPYQVLLPFIVVAAWFGGAMPALLVTVLCTIWAVTHTSGQLSTLAQQIELLLFLPIGAFVAAVCGSLNRARDEAETAARQLSVSQQHYQSIVETASEGIWTADAKLRTTFANARMAQILGTTCEEMLGKPVSEFLFEPDRAIPLESLEAGLLEKPHAAERRYRRSDGAEIWCQVNASPIRDHKGQMLGILALHTDITQRREQSAALRESHKRFELATRAVAGYIYEYDIQTDTFYRSTGFVDVVGHEQDAVPKSLDWWRSQLHPQDVAAFEENIRRSMQGGDQCSIEYRARHADGGYRWLWDRSLVTRDETGRVSRVIGSVSDISARKSMEVALREGEATFRQLADSMPQIVWASNARGVPDYFNRQWYQYSGQPEGLIGQGSWEEFFHPDDIDAFAQIWDECRIGTRAFLGEARIRDHQGTYRWFLCRASPVKDEESGELLRWFGTATDIDAQKRAADDQKFLAEVGVLLNASLDPEITLEQVTRLAVPHLGDWCVVALKNAEGHPEMVAAAHSDPEKIAAFWKRHRKYGFDPRATKGFPVVIRTGVPEIIEKVDAEMWLRHCHRQSTNKKSKRWGTAPQ
jgi:PAS domain S-box-containing protein